eukprot:TRINITY_DN38437_c0_g1_i1.p1 TRINITY_DN38437_c0_g1~~TRINITY_DN38437_c0_g1_i1.p1  ORF type:complete len:427 (+),score=57.27 TRINITY_DN38437_c0_g1_i1:45-1325(+)
MSSLGPWMRLSKNAAGALRRSVYGRKSLCGDVGVTGASALGATDVGSCRWRSTALASIFHGANKPFELREIPLPDKLNEGEMLVRLEAATICGSDLHTVSGKRQEPVPLVLGHEGVGVIERIGSDIFTPDRPRNCSWHAREGDRVTFTVADSCGVCPECMLHKLPQKCVSLMKYGHEKIDSGSGLNGTYASHILLRRGTHVVPLPSSISSRVASPANCALATVANSLDLGRLPRFGANNSAVVQGAGLLGIYAVAWLKKRVGMDKVFCLDMDRNRLATAEKFGAIPVLIQAGEEHAHERMKLVKSHCPYGVDIVVEMTGARTVVSEGVSFLRNGGHYAFCGMVHPDSQLSSLTGETIIRKCVTIRGVHNYTPWNLSEAIAFLKEFRDELPLESVLSPTSYGLTEMDVAFKEAFGNKYCRVVVDCQK